MKKKILNVFCIVILLMLCGCEGHRVDENGNAVITSNWKYIESTVNGNTVNYENESPLVKIFVAPASPEFKSSNGVDCVFSINKRKHTGTMTEQDGKYIIDFDDSYKNMIAEIDGDLLTLRSENGNVEVVFRAK